MGLSKLWNAAQGNNSLPKSNLSRIHPEGVLFLTYALLVSGSKDSAGETAINDAEQEISMKVARGSRLEQAIEWLKADPKPLIILDECHKAKNLLPGGKGELLE